MVVLEIYEVQRTTHLQLRAQNSSLRASGQAHLRLHWQLNARAFSSWGLHG